VKASEVVVEQPHSNRLFAGTLLVKQEGGSSSMEMLVLELPS